MPAALIYNSDDEDSYPSGSDYFSGFGSVLIELANSPVLTGAWVEVRLLLEILMADWQSYQFFTKRYPIASPTQNILLAQEIPRTQSPDSRLKLFVELSNPDASIVKAYVF